MSRNCSISVRVTSDVKTAAEKAAKADNRSLASLAGIALVDLLQERGYLGEGVTKTARDDRS